MLTKRQNLMETITGGNPDRFVNQYEFMEIIRVPGRKRPLRGETIVNEWGITYSWPEDQMGPYPVHDGDLRVLTDVTKWKEVIKAPSFDLNEAAWADASDQATAVDRADKFASVIWAPGTFEMTHAFMGMEDAMMALYEEPECMHEFIDYLTDFEIGYAEKIIDHVKPDLLFHHDDWGGQISTFLSPQMFEEFYVEPYKRLYGFWKDNGVELVVHHSDCYAASLVPHMIDMGIDIWQGVMTTNNTPELIEKYGGKISFMGELDNNVLDRPDWDAGEIAAHVEKACTACGKHYFIPCLIQGINTSSFPGVYDAATEAIDNMSKKFF